MMMVVTRCFSTPVHRRSLEVLGVYAASARTFAAAKDGADWLWFGRGVLVVQLVYPFRYTVSRVVLERGGLPLLVV